MRTRSVLVATVAFGITSVIADPVDPAAIVAAHNVSRTAVGVAPVRWSDALRERAEKWAAHLRDHESCRMEHSPGSGENLYKAGPHQAASERDSDGNWLWKNSLQSVSEADVVGLWDREKQWYDHATNTCSAPANKSCGHYTQVVWRNSLEVGCAKAICSDFSQVWVCNYAPAGNVQGEKPY
jgi:pathogenesis-related protein 1